MNHGIAFESGVIARLFVLEFGKGFDHVEVFCCRPIGLGDQFERRNAAFNAIHAVECLTQGGSATLEVAGQCIDLAQASVDQLLDLTGVAVGVLEACNGLIQRVEHADLHGDALAQPLDDGDLGFALLPALVVPEVAGDLVALLPLQARLPVAPAAGLEWVQSYADKVAQVQAAIAAEPQPVRVPREPKPVVLPDEGPLVLVETRRDLRELQLPFEATPAA